MKKSKKLLSVFVAFVMLISTMAVGFCAFADDTAEITDSAVYDAEEKVDAFSSNATYLFITSNAERHEAAVAAYDEATAAIKALSEEQKLQMDVALYGYMLNYVAESVGRDADQGTSSTAKTWATMNALSDIEAVVGELPSDYKAVYDAYTSFYTLYGEDNATVYYINSRSGYSWDMYDEAVSAYDTWFNALSGMSQAQFDFSNYLSPSTSASTAGFYFYSTSTSMRDVTADNIISYRYNIIQDTTTETGSDVSTPNRSDYISRTGSYSTGYTYEWTEGNSGQTYIDAWNAAYQQINEEQIPIAIQAYRDVLEKFDTLFPGLAEAGEAILTTGVNYIKDSESVATEELEDAYEKLNALSDTARAFFDTVSDNSVVKLIATLNTSIEFNENTDAELAYNNQPSVSYVYALDIAEQIEDYIDSLYLSEFTEFIASVDVDSRTEEEIAEAQELYVRISNKGNIDSDTYNKFVSIIYPIYDEYDYADEIAAFTATEFVRPPESSVAWTEGGIQSFADKLDSLLGSFVDIESLLSDNLYQVDIINSLLSLYATLSHNTTEISVSSGSISLNLTLGEIVTWIVTPDSLAAQLEESKFAGAVEKINSIELTEEEEAQGINEYDKLAAIAFTAEDWGFTAGDKDGFIDALLAVLRPITVLLDPDASIRAMGLVSVSIGIKMFDYTVSDAGEYVPGVYEKLLPLFEQLGLNDLPTAEEYKENYYAVKESQGGNIAADEFLRPILESLFTNIVDPLCASPINTLVDVLPRLAYVIDGDRLNTIIKDALSQLGLLSGLAGSLDLSTDAINDLIPDTIDVGSLIGDGTELVLNIGDIPWSELADCATLSAVPSSTIYHAYTLLRTGETDSCLSTILYWLYDVALADSDTYATIKSLITSLVPDSFASLVNTIIAQVLDPVQAAGKVDGYGLLLDNVLIGGTPTGLEIWKIEASAGEGGSIDPSGTTELKQADSKTFTVTADAGNTIYSLTVNGEPVADAAGLSAYEYTVEGSAVTSSDSELYYPADVIIEVLFADEDGNLVGTPDDPDSPDVPDDPDEPVTEPDADDGDDSGADTDDPDGSSTGGDAGTSDGGSDATGSTVLNVDNSNPSVPNTGAQAAASIGAMITVVLATAAGVIVWLLLRKRMAPGSK